MKDNFEFAIIHLEKAMHFADLKLKDAAQRNDMELYDNLIIVKNVQATTMKALRIAAKAQELGKLPHLDEAFGAVENYFEKWQQHEYLEGFHCAHGEYPDPYLRKAARKWNELQKVMNDENK